MWGLGKWQDSSACPEIQYTQGIVDKEGMKEEFGE